MGTVLLFASSHGKGMQTAWDEVTDRQGDLNVQWKSGAQFQDLKDMLRASDDHADHVIIHGGHNNLLDKSGNVISHPGRIVKMAVSVLHVARHQFPDSKIHFSALYPRRDTENWQSEKYMVKARYINTKIAAECKKRGWGFMSHQTLWFSNRTAWPGYLLKDGLHLNRRGKEKVVREVLEAISL